MVQAPPSRVREDRRVRRTQGLLRRALLELLTEQPWESIAIQQICDRADVARSTFYNHFADKEDLLLAGFRELRGHLEGQMRERGDFLGFVEPLLEHADAHAPVFDAIVGRRTAQVVRQHFVDLIAEILRPWLRDPSVPWSEGKARFAAGGLVEMLGWWLENARPVPRGELRGAMEGLLRQTVAGEFLERTP